MIITAFMPFRFFAQTPIFSVSRILLLHLLHLPSPKVPSSLCDVSTPPPPPQCPVCK